MLTHQGETSMYLDFMCKLKKNSRWSDLFQNLGVMRQENATSCCYSVETG